MAQTPEIQPDSIDTENDTEAHLLKEALVATVAAAVIAGGAAVHAGPAHADDKKPAATEPVTPSKIKSTDKNFAAADLLVRQ
jgi:hypothetical protein